MSRRRKVGDAASQRIYGEFADGIRFRNPELRRRLLGILWRLRGSCVQHDVRLWFTERTKPSHRVLAMCRGCPVRGLCLASSIAYAEEFGVWGGYTAPQREAMILTARQGVPVDHIVTSVLSHEEDRRAAAS
ncbi:transcriptional regulator [Knoellia sinensis KCTC 19936]|uniref:Transcriptional regulator WhiB n=1 Tax=Knoellia sinensis KCTC 19936 TaxID=1385520 RepID=A0A0A0J215_9MICO|nr:WhiB family transcriptional regulator [Knoellia sinensis]KGN31138.1 transcriptional regulator [Knoellia sinensis KCTC 19936]